MTDTRKDTGTATRREVLGDDHVDQSIAGTTPFSAPFQDYITGAAWADIWTRPGLERPMRCCITVALLAALGQEHELAMHVRAAVRAGVTAETIREVLLHTAVYAGVPAANRAFTVAQDTLAALGIPEAQPDASAGGELSTD